PSPLWSWVCSVFFFFSGRRRHTSFSRDWSSDVCSSDLVVLLRLGGGLRERDHLSALLGLVPARRQLTTGRFGDVGVLAAARVPRSEERRVGKEGRARGWQ